MGRKYELIVDNFAGGGGASTGIEMALGRSPDVAINHDPEALAMHEANHPKTRHYATDVFEIDPRVCVRNQPVGLAWFSPDCTHHSKARGGKPIREAGKKSRALAWVVIKWAERVRPRLIFMENVIEWLEWSPVIPKVNGDGLQARDIAGRPMYVPCPQRKGVTFRRWLRKLQRLGYAVEWREMRASDYGAPTIRKRLFLIARCDGKPIVWPEPTHGDPASEGVKSGKLLPWRSAAENIDWSLPCPSIFMSPEEAKRIGCKRPLKPNTMQRIGRGTWKYAINSPNPFIVVCNHGGDWFRRRGVEEPFSTVTASRDAHGVVMPFVSTYHGAKADDEARGFDAREPLRTQDTENRFSVVAPFTVPRYQERDGQLPRCGSVEQPAPTIVPTANGQSLIVPHLLRQFGRSDVAAADAPAPTVMPAGQGKTALVAAFLAQHNTGMVGHSAREPLSTITNRGTQQQVVAAVLQANTTGHAATDPASPLPTLTTGNQQMLAASFLSQQRGSNTGGGNGDLTEPLNGLTAGGNHVAEVRAFLMKYYGAGVGQECDDPLHTIVSKERFGLVQIHGQDWEIVDIGMRMLTARELFKMQGFPETYQIRVWSEVRFSKDRKRIMKPGYLAKDAQVRMCGNSVCPQLAAALVKANCPELAKQKRTKQRELAGV